MQFFLLLRYGHDYVKVLELCQEFNLDILEINQATRSRDVHAAGQIQFFIKKELRIISYLLRKKNVPHQVLIYFN